MKRSFHRSMITMQSVKDSFEEIKTKIMNDPEALDTNALHEAIKELSSSLDGVEKLGYSQISAIILNISKCEILARGKDKAEEKFLNLIQETPQGKLLDFIQDVIFVTTSVSNRLEEELKGVEKGTSESNTEEELSGIFRRNLINKSADSLSSSPVHTKSPFGNDTTDTEGRKEEERPGSSDTVALNPRRPPTDTKSNIFMVLV